MSITAVVASVSFVLLLRPAAPDTSHLAGPPLEVPAPGTAAASTAPSGSAPTVRLVAGAGDLDVPVIPGDGATVPLNRAMHYPRTAWPGDGSNSLFYAHAQPHMFLGLYRLHPGDDVVAFRSDGSQLTYRVRAVERVAYSDQNVLKPTAFEQLTLLTCTSYNPVEPRLVVIATPA